MAVGDPHVFPVFLTPVLTELSFQQRGEAKICREESSPQPGLELTTTKSQVRHARH